MWYRHLLLLIIFLSGTSLFGASFVDADRVVFDNNAFVIKDTRVSIGLPLDAATASADVSGNAFFRGYVGVTPVITNTLPIDWRQGSHQLVTLPASAVTQNISFVDPPGSTVVFLVMYRKCPVDFPDSVIWKNGAEFSFSRPTTFSISTAPDPNQMDILSFMYDASTRTYLGEVSLDFKKAVQYPDGI